MYNMYISRNPNASRCHPHVNISRSSKIGCAFLPEACPLLARGLQFWSPVSRGKASISCRVHDTEAAQVHFMLTVSWGLTAEGRSCSSEGPGKLYLFTSLNAVMATYMLRRDESSIIIW